VARDIRPRRCGLRLAMSGRRRPPGDRSTGTDPSVPYRLAAAWRTEGHATSRSRCSQTPGGRTRMWLAPATTLMATSRPGRSWWCATPAVSGSAGEDTACRMPCGRY